MKVMIENGAFLPERAHPTDAGLDLRSREKKIIWGNSAEVFHTGVHIQLPPSCAGLLVSKSGLNVKFNLTSTGLIDEGYTGEICVKLYNHGTEPYMVEVGDKISQLVVIPVRYEEVDLVQDLEATERGNNGFGSSGR